MNKRTYILLFLILSLACGTPLAIATPEPGSDLPINQTAVETAVISNDTPANTAPPEMLQAPLPTPTLAPSPQARVAQGDWALFLGDYDLARQEYQNALQSSEDIEIKAAAEIGLGRCEFLTGNQKTALQIFQAASINYPQSEHLAEAYFFIGQTQEALGDPRYAADAYARYITLRPGLLDGYLQNRRGETLVAAGDYAGAITAYQTAIDSGQISDPLSLRIKIIRAYLAMGDYNSTIRLSMDIYNTTTNDYVKAQMNWFLGQAYSSLGMPEQAHARYQDSVSNFPLAYDSYTALVALVNDGIPVNDLDRGMVDYHANQYGVALDALTRYLLNNPDHDGTAHHYKALSLRAMERYNDAINEWKLLIRDHNRDRFFTDAWKEIAYTQWAFQNQFYLASQTLLTFVNEHAGSSEAPQMLFDAARLLERDNRLNDAAATWERMMNEYPNVQISYQGLSFAAITYYRQGHYPLAYTAFQRLLVLAATPADQAMAYFWMGKAQWAQKDEQGARASWEQAVLRDPSGYYGLRAHQLMEGKPAFYAGETFDLGFDLAQERIEAETWLRRTFDLAPDTNLASPGALADNPRLRRGDALWDLGRYTEAHNEYEALRLEIQADPASNFRLLDHLLELGFYRSAILTSRQILDLANMDDAATLNAPVYFNHIRFGPYFKNIVMPAAQKYNFHPFFLFSTIRQESMFEGFIESSAGARGLMQIMPQTGQEIYSVTNWPPNYVDRDLYRPFVNIPMGTHYLSRQRDYFGGDLLVALASYNGGPGNALQWQKIAGGDQDLFAEVVRFRETRDYIRQIVEFTEIYRKIYERQP